MVASATQLTQDGSAFVRLRLPKHQLYVGESMPVDIQVGVRDGLVATLSGLPSFGGDSFTLNNLSTKPEEAREIIGGQPFTVLIWHSALAAVKPGTASLTIDTPLTVRMQSMRPSAANPSGDPALDEFFNDPFFQKFFGVVGTTEKEITLASPPTSISVMALPAQSRPEGFSGAVGHFKITSELSAATTTVGDPLTLRMHVSGAGNFDRVRSGMLGSAHDWKTYPPTATFTATDSNGYHGEKVFEQVAIAKEPGNQTLPALAFSYFDPDAGRYESAQTPPISVAVIPAAASSSAANGRVPNDHEGKAREGRFASPALRPDYADTGNSVASLVPRYFQPPFLAVPSAMALAFTAAWFWLRRREQAANDSRTAVQRATSQATATWLAQMETAAARGDAQVFFSSARSVLRQALGARWHVAPQSIGLEEIDAHLGPDDQDVRQLFASADEATYSGCDAVIGDLEHWKHVVLRQLNDEADTVTARMTIALLTLALGAGIAHAATGVAPQMRAGYSAPRLFDLANAYVRDGKPGMAVLNYERGRLLAPNDPDIQANLSFARTKSGLPPITDTWFERQATGLASPNTLFWFGCVGLLTVGASLLLARQYPRRRLALRACTAAGFALMAVTLCNALAIWPMMNEAVVIARETPVRVAPVSVADSLMALREGEILTVDAEVRDFTLVHADTGRTGWVASADIAPVVPR
jgi:hypothetical protein